MNILMRDLCEIHDNIFVPVAALKKIDMFSFLLCFYLDLYEIIGNVGTCLF